MWRNLLWGCPSLSTSLLHPFQRIKYCVWSFSIVIPALVDSTAPGRTSVSLTGLHLVAKDIWPMDCCFFCFHSFHFIVALLIWCLSHVTYHHSFSSTILPPSRCLGTIVDDIVCVITTSNEFKYFAPPAVLCQTIIVVVRTQKCVDLTCTSTQSERFFFVLLVSF